MDRNSSMDRYPLGRMHWIKGLLIGGLLDGGPFDGSPLNGSP